jgi:hypothetical protein
LRRSLLSGLLMLAALAVSRSPVEARPGTTVAATPAGEVQFPGGLAGLAPAGYNFPIALHTGQDVVLGSPGVAFDGVNFFVPWYEGADTYGARVSATGTLLDTNPISISVGLNESVLHPSTVFDGHNFFVFWTAVRSGVAEVYGARVTPEGAVLDPAGLQLTTGGAPQIRRPGVALGEDILLVAWRTSGNNIRATRVTTAGVNLDAPAGFAIASGSTSYYPAVAFDGENYLVVWHDSRNAVTSGWDVYGARVTLDGEVLDPDGFLIADDPQNQEHATVAFDGTNYLVAWYDWRPNNHSMYGSAYAARVSPEADVLDDPGFQIAERARGQVPVQLNCGGLECLVVWGMPFEPGNGYNFRLTDLYARRVVSGSVVDAQAIPVATAYGHQFGPVVGHGAGRYLVAWSESTGRVEVGSVFGQLLEEKAPAVGRLAPGQPGPAFGSGAPQGASDWVQESAPVSDYLNAGVAFSATNAYAFGDNQALHYAGGEWQQVATFDYRKTYGAWASGPANILVAGWCRAINFFDGDEWIDEGCHAVPPGTWSFATGLWGTGLDPAEVWASTTQGDVMKRQAQGNGYQWEQTTTGVPFDLTDIWGSAANNLYATGEFGAILHFTGTAWSPVAGLPTIQTLNAIWGSGPGDIFAAGDWGTILHYDGQAWTAQASGTGQHLFDLWGRSGEDVYAVGLNGAILHYDGTGWTTEASGTNMDLLAVWGVVDPAAAQIVVWAAGTGSTILKKPILFDQNYLPLLTQP